MAHKAERAAFSKALDLVLKAGTSEDRADKVDKFIDLAGKLLKDTAPSVTKGLKNNIYPGSKWEKYLFDIIDESDPHVLKTVLLNGGYEAAFRGLRTTTENAEKYDRNIPWIILFDPTSACNKHCIGCWSADAGRKWNLTYDEMDSFLTQAEELGTHMFMMTGGEPLVRKKDIVKLMGKHDKSLFNIFTNGSLIDDEFAEEARNLGNVVFSISVEGYEKSNDARRGDGSYDEAMRAMRMLKEHGLIFGTSTAYTRYNTEDVMSDEFLHSIEDAGARWAWMFQFMPTSKSASADMMPTVEQREYVIQRTQFDIPKDSSHNIICLEFQNMGRFVGGCIAGGRVYCHVAADGSVSPCVFIPFTNKEYNIKEKSWLECLGQPLFQAYRAHYPFSQNALKPCPMLENPTILPEMVKESGAVSTGYDEKESAEDLEKKVTKYAEEWAPEADRIWREWYPGGKQTFDNPVTSMSIEDKAKLIADDDDNDGGNAVA